MSEATTKWVRMQASLDELSDALITDMNTVIELIREGKTEDAIATLDEMIEEVGAFTAEEKEVDEEE